jgi:hypothetical protein
VTECRVVAHAASSRRSSPSWEETGNASRKRGTSFREIFWSGRNFTQKLRGVVHDPPRTSAQLARLLPSTPESRVVPLSYPKRYLHPSTNATATNELVSPGPIITCRASFVERLSRGERDEVRQSGSPEVRECDEDRSFEPPCLPRVSISPDNLCRR